MFGLALLFSPKLGRLATDGRALDMPIPQG